MNQDKSKDTFAHVDVCGTSRYESDKAALIMAAAIRLTESTAQD